MKQKIARAKRLVIKVGSSLLVDKTSGALRTAWLASLVDDVVAYLKQGKELVIVSSGAVALGRRQLHPSVDQRSLQPKEKRAAAAVGQIQLSHAYQHLFAQHHIVAAQMLFTLQDSENRRRYLNTKDTLATLFAIPSVPIINENDTVATQDLRYGDNDRLAARIAQMINADLLVLLSDIDGLYTANPQLDSSAKLILVVDELTHDIMHGASDSVSGLGSGGMRSKLAAAKIAMSCDCHMIIANGTHPHPLARIDQAHTPCTYFIPHQTHLSARKSWLAQHLQPVGTLVIDDGAVAALSRGGSLLPSGVRQVSGLFQRGDPVIITDQRGREVGRGLSSYSSHEATQIIGHKSAEYASILGYAGAEEIVHRNDLVFLSGEQDEQKYCS